MSVDSVWVGSMPELYDRELGPALFVPYAEELARRAAARQPGRVLELAAGTGIVTRALVRALPRAEVVATDLNDAMVGWGAEHVPAAAWRQADAQALDFADGSFDLVVCSFGAMFFPDRVRAYAEAARVLVPGGALLLTVWDRVEGSRLPSALVQALAAVLPEDPPVFLTRTPHGYADPERIRADLESGGLEVESLDRQVLSGRARSARGLVAGFCLGSPLRFELAERGELTDLVDRLSTVMEQRLGAGELEGELTAWVVTAVRAGAS